MLRGLCLLNEVARTTYSSAEPPLQSSAKVSITSRLMNTWGLVPLLVSPPKLALQFPHCRLTDRPCPLLQILILKVLFCSVPLGNDLGKMLNVQDLLTTTRDSFAVHTSVAANSRDLIPYFFPFDLSFSVYHVLPVGLRSVAKACRSSHSLLHL